MAFRACFDPALRELWVSCKHGWLSAVAARMGECFQVSVGKVHVFPAEREVLIEYI